MKLNEGSTEHCAGCFKNKMIAGRLCIVVDAKFVPKDCYFAVNRKFYFCAVTHCLKNKQGSSNLRCLPERVEADRTIDDSTKQLLTLFRMGIFGAAHGWGGKEKRPTYPTKMELGTVIYYLKKILKIYESRDTPLQLC